jgi:hypothetical protein
VGLERHQLQQRRSSRAAVSQSVSQSPKTTGAAEKLKAEQQSVTSHQRLVENAQEKVKRSLTPKIVYKTVLAHFLLKQKVLLILTGKCFQLTRDFISWPQQCLHQLCQFRSCCKDSQ